MATGIATSREEAIRKLGEMIHGIQFAMLTTHDDRGNLHSRPMATQQAGFDGTLWFLTGHSTAKSHQIEKDQHVNISYADPQHHRYISISGTAEILNDQ